MATVKNSIEKNETTYTSYKVVIGKTEWSVLVVSGKFNYVTVTNTSYGRRTFGKDYKNFDDAIMAYKNPEMKLELLKIEMGL